MNRIPNQSSWIISSFKNFLAQRFKKPKSEEIEFNVDPKDVLEMPVYSTTPTSWKNYHFSDTNIDISITSAGSGSVNWAVGSKDVQSINDIWKRLKELEDDAELRKRHPGLQELWEQYNSFKALCEEKDKNDQSDS